MKSSATRAAFVAAFAALTFVACSESTTSPDMAAQLAKGGVSNPNTEVNATFVIYIEGQEILKPAGTAVGGGTCLVGGVYSQHNGQQSAKVPHPLCVDRIEGYELTVNWSEIANYVLSSNGNVQLNFSQLCNELFVCTPRGIQFKKTGNFTVGFGTLNGTDQNGGSWTITLTQGNTNTNGNIIIRTGTLVEACNAELGCHPGYLKW